MCTVRANGVEQSVGRGALAPTVRTEYLQYRTYGVLTVQDIRRKYFQYSTADALSADLINQPAAPDRGECWPASGAKGREPIGVKRGIR